ncbi:MAG: hypothetical protein D6732_02415 [Methanobacteriota archaeon]|nr:MAG: hypothetical protein D6732_02415 [Euryarchaeota archaeon]
MKDILDQHYLMWVILSVILGLVFPKIAILLPLSEFLLATMVFSIVLNIEAEHLLSVSPKSIAIIFTIQFLMPLLGFAIALLLGLHPYLIIGFALIGAVTPEFVAPVQTRLAGGNVALAVLVLILSAILGMGFIPLIIKLLGIQTTFNPWNLGFEILKLITIPMILSFLIRRLAGKKTYQYSTVFTNVAIICVLLLIAIASAENASFIIEERILIPKLVVGALTLNSLGYGIGYVSGKLMQKEDRIASVFSIGMRDFAVAATLVFSVNLPSISALPAVIYGIVEMISSTALLKFFYVNHS